MTSPYYYVHKLAGKYAITLGTEDTPPVALPTDKRYDDLEDAMERACDNDEGYDVKASAEVEGEWAAMGR